jgi:hypothetical protein
MASITCWTRLEPRQRTPALERGLQARVHDPLWMLTRQWQLGEFQGEDAGTPTSVRLRGEAARLTRWRPGAPGGTAAGLPYDGRTPLEALVERETPDPAHPARAAESGMHFLRLLAAAGAAHLRDAYRAAYPLAAPAAGAGLDPAEARFLRVMAGRAVDGSRLHAAFTAAATATSTSLPAVPQVPEADRPAVLAAARGWLAWYARRHGGAAGAWVGERLEHAFSVAARTSSGEVVMGAAEYSGGHLDWHHFNRVPGAALGAAADPAPQPVVQTVIPGPVTFRGMPEPRWWTFEDADTSLGRVEAGPEDLGRTLLLHYALTGSDDWFLLPVEVEVGSILEVRSLVVTDTFGVRTRIRPFHYVDGAAGTWRMFTQSEAGGAGAAEGHRLFIPPVLGPGLAGRAVEEVHFLRDEMANLAWAVERRVEGVHGRATDRHERYLAARPDPAAASSAAIDADLVYRLQTEVPEHWIPLVPVADAGSTAPRLKRGVVLQHRGQAFRAAQPLGRILEPGRDLRIPDEEVPREGVQVTRGYQLARWTDGSTHLWMARRKRTGRGEGWSGLRFDVVEPAGGGSPV